MENRIIKLTNNTWRIKCLDGMLDVYMRELLKLDLMGKWNTYNGE